MPAPDGALAGIRVLDATQMLAGPICGMRLGDLGADVIKVEPPLNGEFNRTHSLNDAEAGGEMTTFLALNRNKRSVPVNLKDPAGVEVLHDLVRTSDVFIQNFRVGTGERLGVGYEQLRSINPGLIYCSISGYGQVGPYRDRPGQDLVIQGYSGSMWAVGAQDDPPSPGALWAADVMAGYQAAIGILAALHARGHTKRGQRIDVNMLAVVMDAQAQEIVSYLVTGREPERRREPTAHVAMPAPYGVYRTADGWLTLAMSPLSSLGEVLDNDRLRALTDYNDGFEYADEVYGIVRAALPARSTAEWLELMDRHGVWAGPVYTHADLVEDEHVNATGMLTDVEHPTAGTLRMPNIPVALSDTAASIRRPPPLLGEHTVDVLSELGYSSERIAALEAAGAIGARGAVRS